MARKQGRNYYPTEPSWVYGNKNKARITITEAQTAWEIISANPRISVRELAGKLDLPLQRTHDILTFLTDGEHLDRVGQRAIEVHVPLVSGVVQPIIKLESE